MVFQECERILLNKMNQILFIDKYSEYDVYQVLNMAKAFAKTKETLIIDLTRSEYFKNILKSELNELKSSDDVYKLPFMILMKNLNILGINKNVPKEDILNILEFLQNKNAQIILIYQNLNEWIPMMSKLNSMNVNFIDFSEADVHEIDIINLKKNNIKQSILIYSFDIYDNSLQKKYLDFNQKYNNYIFEPRIHFSMNYNEPSPFIIDHDTFDEELVKFYEELISKSVF